MIDEAHLRQWIGKSEEQTDLLTPATLASYAAMLDYEANPWSGTPALAHWLCFHPHERQSHLGEDGHPPRGGLIPPVPLPRRMWAGGEVEFLQPLPVGASLTRRSTVSDVTHKSGKSGSLVFVTLRHEISADGALCVVERQDIVFRGEDSGAAPPPAAKQSINARRMVADSRLLFRFSALTFNAHRIHYDRAYATSVENYPGLVVHGPLQAMLLMDHFQRRFPQKKISKFRHRARAPLFDGTPFDLCLAETSDGADLWTADAQGGVAMEAGVVAS